LDKNGKPSQGFCTVVFKQAGQDLDMEGISLLLVDHWLLSLMFGALIRRPYKRVEKSNNQQVQYGFNLEKRTS
jgi:hypothetical protein